MGALAVNIFRRLCQAVIMTMSFQGLLFRAIPSGRGGGAGGSCNVTYIVRKGVRHGISPPPFKITTPVIEGGGQARSQPSGGGGVVGGSKGDRVGWGTGVWGEGITRVSGPVGGGYTWFVRTPNQPPLVTGLAGGGGEAILHPLPIMGIALEAPPPPPAGAGLAVAWTKCEC